MTDVQLKEFGKFERYQFLHFLVPKKEVTFQKTLGFRGLNSLTFCQITNLLSYCPG